MRVRPDLIAARLGLDPEQATVEDVRENLGEPTPAWDDLLPGHFDDAGAYRRIQARTAARPAAPLPPQGLIQIRSVEDLQRAIVLTRAQNDKADWRAYIVARAEALGAMARVPHAWRHVSVQASGPRDDERLDAAAIAAIFADPTPTPAAPEPPADDPDFDVSDFRLSSIAGPLPSF